MNTSFLKWLWTSSLVCNVFAMDGKAGTDGKGLPPPRPNLVGNSNGFSALQRPIPLSSSFTEAPTKMGYSPGMTLRKPPNYQLPNYARAIFNWFRKPKGEGCEDLNEILSLLKKSRKFTQEEIYTLKERFQHKPSIDERINDIAEKEDSRGFSAMQRPIPLPSTKTPTKRKQNFTEPAPKEMRIEETTPLLETQAEHNARVKLKEMESTWSLDDIYKGFKAIAWKHSNKENLCQNPPKEYWPQNYQNASTANFAINQ